jgi:hypothetical protein
MQPARLILAVAIPRLGIPRFPGGGKRLLAPGTKGHVGASKQFREVALLEGASSSCRGAPLIRCKCLFHLNVTLLKNYAELPSKDPRFPFAPCPYREEAEKDDA